MSLLFETIRIEHSQVANARWHLARIAESLEKVFGCNLPVVFPDAADRKGISPLNLFEELTHFSLPEELHKCRVIYDTSIIDIQITPYLKKTPKTFKLIECDSISYSFKLTDRQELDRLFGLRNDADEIIIVRNGCITDTSIANLVFFDGKNYFTPDTPLLEGTHRARLLFEQKIIQCRISADDLKKYISFKPINAMSEEGFKEMISVKNIIF
jgi:4-amino-4-deoxychorismate lyase